MSPSPARVVPYAWHGLSPQSPAGIIQSYTSIPRKRRGDGDDIPNLKQSEIRSPRSRDNLRLTREFGAEAGELLAHAAEADPQKTGVDLKCLRDFRRGKPVEAAEEELLVDVVEPAHKSVYKIGCLEGRKLTPLERRRHEVSTQMCPGQPCFDGIDRVIQFDFAPLPSCLPN